MCDHKLPMLVIMAFHQVRHIDVFIDFLFVYCIYRQDVKKTQVVVFQGLFLGGQPERVPAFKSL